MNRLGAMEVADLIGPEPQLPGVRRQTVTPVGDASVMAGRIRQPAGGACFFVW